MYYDDEDDDEDDDDDDDDYYYYNCDNEKNVWNVAVDWEGRVPSRPVNSLLTNISIKRTPP